jgi:hypothetical protein
MFGIIFDGVFGPIFGDDGAGPTPPAPVPVMVDRSLIDAALNRLCEYCKENPITTAITQAVVTPFLDIETAYRALLAGITLDDAIGVQLDLVGKIVGQVRNGMSDDDYRRYCRARIAVNRSRGTTEDLILVTTLAINEPGAVYRVEREGVATLVIRVTEVAITTAVAIIGHDLAYQAHAAGVRLLLEYSESPPANTFRFDSGPGWDTGHLAGAIG